MTTKIEDYFRLDIQGLRAIAILAVVIFHIDATKLPGGYVGVDIFFVISGFLITAHIVRDITNNSFSFKNFYLKRIRRLYPALIATLAATSVAVYWLYLPTDAEFFGQALISTVAYASNFFFYSQSGYFDDQLHGNPLVHTWSLSVEEQFYLFFPIILFFIYKTCKRHLNWILVSIAFVSFLSSEMLLHFDPAASFFFSPTRFGQFIIGGLIAIAPKPKLSKIESEAVCIAGLFFLFIAIFYFTSKTPFPGMASLIPTLGAGFIIYAGSRRDLISFKLLSMKPMQFIGNISYSFYLWHWPIVTIYRYQTGDEILRFEKIYVFLACLIAGYLSYRFIEKPGLKLNINKPFLFRLAFGCTLVAFIVGIFFVQTDGLAQRYPAIIQKITSYQDYEISVLNESCFIKDNRVFDPKICLNTIRDKKNILIIGDSHAAHLYEGMRQEFPEMNILLATHSGCRELLNTDGKESCVKFRQKLFYDYLPRHHYDVILLSGSWKKDEAHAFKNTIRELRKHTDKVVVSGPIITYSISLPKLIALSVIENNPEIINEARKIEETTRLDALVEKAVEAEGAKYFSALKALCEGKVCKAYTGDYIPLQFDYGHLTKEGSIAIAKKMRDSTLFK